MEYSNDITPFYLLNDTILFYVMGRIIIFFFFVMEKNGILVLFINAHTFQLFIVTERFV